MNRTKEKLRIRVMALILSAALFTGFIAQNGVTAYATHIEVEVHISDGTNSLDDVKVTVKDSMKKFLKSQNTSSGTATFELISGNEYYISAERTGYYTVEKHIQAGDHPVEINMADTSKYYTIHVTDGKNPIENAVVSGQTIPDGYDDGGVTDSGKLESGYKESGSVDDSGHPTPGGYEFNLKTDQNGDAKCYEIYRTNIECQGSGVSSHFTVSKTGYGSFTASTFYSDPADGEQTIEISPKPVLITAQPKSVDLHVGDKLTLSVTAENATHYQWYKRDVSNIIMIGSDDATLSLSKVTSADAGKYYCVISGVLGDVSSQEAMVNVSKNDTTFTLAANPPTGQVRPKSIELTATGLPEDASGEITFKFANINIKTVTLPNRSIKFAAIGSVYRYLLTAEYSGDYKYKPSSSSPSLDYNFIKGTQTGFAFENPTPAHQTYSPAFSFKNKAFGGQTDGKPTYSIAGGTGVAKIDPSTGVLTGVTKCGSIDVLATKAGDDDYNQTSATYTVTIDRADQTDFDFTDKNPGNIKYSPSFSFINAATGGQSTGTVTYSIIDGSGSAKINTATGEITDVTSCESIVVSATKAGDDLYNPITKTYTLMVDKADQTDFLFTTPTPARQTYSSSFRFVNTVSGGQTTAAPVYSITGDTGRAQIDPCTGEIRNVTKCGTIAVRATKAGNAVYNPVDASYTLMIDKAEQTGLAFATAKPVNIKYGQMFTNPVSGGQSNGPITYQVTENSADANVDACGTVTMAKTPADAATGSVTITVTATRAADDLYLAKTISYPLTIDRDNISNHDFTVNDAPIKEESAWYNSKFEKIVVKPVNGYDLISTDGAAWTKELSYTNDELIRATFYLKKSATDEITNRVTKKINFDKTAPTAKIAVDNNIWTSFINTVSFGLFYDSSESVRISAADNLSSVSSVEYYESNSKYEESSKDVSGFPWRPYEMGTKIELSKKSNKMAVIYAKVTDGAGNIAYFRSEGMVFDNISPTVEPNLPENSIQITLPSTETVGLYNSDVPFRVVVKDPETNGIASGIKSVVTTISAPGKKDKVITVKAKEKDYNSRDSEFNSNEIDKNLFEADDSFIVGKEFESNDITITVVATDKTGNSYKKSISLAMDITPPVIQVAYDNNAFSNNTYLGNNANRKAMITITELNYKNSGVVLDVKKDGKKINITPAFQAVASNETGNNQKKWMTVIDYGTFGDGDYTFAVSCTDLAKNANNAIDYGNSVNPTKFTIDNTKPVIEVTYNNNDARNTNYYKADRIATIKVTEHNWGFDGASFQLNLKAENNDTGEYREIAAPAPSEWTTDGDVHTATIHYAADGKYTFSAQYSDLAGNKAADFAEQVFYIDKTMPALEITGIADQSANKGDVIPVISYSDNNFDTNNVRITLKGANRKAVTPNGGYKNVTNGRVYTFVNFPKTRNVDDIYTLNAEITDLAGNATNKTITFSVNRFGSVYTLDNSLQQIDRKYVKNEMDVVMTETNVDSLKQNTISVKMTKNGTPSDLTEGKDYTVAQKGGNGQWRQYIYTVKKSLFSGDGKYTVAIYSEDSAGNVNENIDEKKKAEIVFGVDKTPPIIEPLDLQSNCQYALERKDATVSVKDNLVLDGVVVYLNNNEVKYTADGENYSFSIPSDNTKQNVRIVALDAAGNKTPVEIKNFLVTTNVFTRWFNNTPLFIGSIAGTGAFAILLLALVFISQRKKKVNLNK